MALGQEAAEIGVERLSGGRRDRGLSIDEGWGGESRDCEGGHGGGVRYLAYTGRRIGDVTDPHTGLACATWPTKRGEP